MATVASAAMPAAEGGSGIAVPSLDNFPSDHVLGVLLHLNVYDLRACSLVSRRFCYLVHAVQDLIVVSECAAVGRSISDDDDDDDSDDDGDDDSAASCYAGNFRIAAQEAISRIRCPPSVAFFFCGSDNNRNRTARDDALLRNLPPNCAVLCASADDIQTNVDGAVISRGQEEGDGVGVLVASFEKSTTKCVPFDIKNMNICSGDASNAISNSFAHIALSALQRKLDEESPDDGGEDYWKLIVIYACGSMDSTDIIVQGLQKSHPRCSITGGICTSGKIRLASENTMCVGDEATEMQRVVDSVFGVALGGNVPVKTVVSFGVRSIIGPSWTVSDARIREIQNQNQDDDSDDDSDDDFDDDSGQFHAIRSIRCEATSEDIVGCDLINRAGRADASYIGLRRTGEDGFDLIPIEKFDYSTGELLLPIRSLENGGGTEATHLGSSLDLFAFDGQACLEDVDRKLNRLKEVVSGQKLLAGLMFSCNGRGPYSGYSIPEKKADATRFEKYFPNTPCLGFYAQGEIGPMAKAGMTTDIFQVGHAALQAFTVVFVLFVVPDVDLGSLRLDDGPDSVSQYIRERFGAAIVRS